MAAEYGGNIAVPGGQIGSGEAQVFNPGQTLQLLGRMEDRADQQAKLEALERIKQQEAAKKAEKEAEVKYPVLDLAENGVFGNTVAKMIPEIHRGAISKIGPAPSNQQNLALVTSDARNEIKRINNVQAKATKEFTETAKQLNDEGYVVDPNVEAAQYDKTEWFGKDIASDFSKRVKSNPRTYNYAKLGDLAASNIGTKTVKVRKADGKLHDETVPIIANYNDKDGRLEIKASEAIPYLQQSPIIKQQLPFVYDAILKEKNVDPSILNKPFAQLTSAEKGHIIDAQKEVADKYLGSRLGYTVVDDFTTTKGDAEQKKVGESVGDVVRAPVNITRDIRYKDEISGITRKMSGMVGAAEQVEIRKGPPVELSSNKNVYIIGTQGEPQRKLLKKAFNLNADGSYTTKFGASVRNWAELKEPVYTLTAPTTVRVKHKGKTFDVTRPAGTVLTQDQGLRAMKSNPQNVRSEMAYILSPTKSQSVASEDPDVADLFKNPSFKDVEMIIPVNQANELAPFSKPVFSKWRK